MHHQTDYERNLIMNIKKIAVLGAGQMGNGIAHVCAQAGYEVKMRDIEQKFIDKGMATIKKNLERGLKKEAGAEKDKSAGGG